MTKGKQACAEGRFQTRKYNDRDGNERTVCGSTFSLASHDSRSVLAVKGLLRRFAPWTVTTLRFRLGLDAAEAWWLQIDGSTRLRIESIDEARGERARALFFRYRDKDFSFTDCCSFVLMQELRIPQVLTLDHHFRQMGFEVVP